MSTSNLDGGKWQNPPAHYAMKPEPIEVIEAWGLGFHLGNAIKYIARADRKGSRLQDLEKAKDYLEREIMREKAKTQFTVKLTNPFMCIRCNRFPCRCLDGPVIAGPLEKPIFCSQCSRDPCLCGQADGR